MNVRSFQLSDANGVTELLAAALSEDCFENTMGPFARQLSWDSDLIMVAEQGGELIGALIGTIDQNHGCIYRIAVHPDFRRQGVGKALVKALEQRFQQRKVRGVWVAGDEHNKAAMPLYEAMGYGASQVMKAFQNLSILAHS
ncbi:MULTISPECIES: GNAT family N-acetyltransferase [unclassified Paenibacillus]|uniref:GNAT family N-acetyltransferase n=1 Tax=Paenibacillus provencensis TaxID=441151 RepID=A0ABW3Q6J3_9BACL|nr:MULTISPECIES: GNAT family N-acetyltransferase [unclassified Paenibacillus]MCM3129473.1 GNAT family N-acetyltransferase [Paenibacillus sp. MER 78]SFS73672.1 Ribosomal protein S18 acetylase RimI [Paenibacillus sp. 453mf]